jgi:hypothetical protein
MLSGMANYEGTLYLFTTLERRSPSSDSWPSNLHLETICFPLILRRFRPAIPLLSKGISNLPTLTSLTHSAP